MLNLNYKLIMLSIFIFGQAFYFVEAQNNDKPNIVIIMADDLGYGDLGSYGHPTNKTPHIDKLAEEGIRLTSFYSSASTCTPARASLLTGRYPLRADMPVVVFPEDDKGLPASEITIAEALKDLGYNTMCVGKWHLGQTREEFLPTSHGFDEYYGLITSNDMMKPWVQTDVPLKIYRNSKPLDQKWTQAGLTADYTREAIEFIKRPRGDSPFFLYLPHNMPHVPLDATERFKEKAPSGIYGDVIEEIDWGVGEIVKALEETGKKENTIIIFLSDNGPWTNMADRLMVENIIKYWHAGTSGLLKGGKINSYEGGFRVPFIASWPGKIPAGIKSYEVVTIMDLFPTLIKAAGGEVPKDRIIDGEDVTRILTGDPDFNREIDFYYFERESLEAVRSGPWKLRIATFQGRGMPLNEDLKPELYNLLFDPSERINRVEEHPEIVAELKEKMLTFDIKGKVIKFD